MQARDGRILFLIKSLIAMVFLSKVSLGSFVPIPSTVSIFIFQKGLHPYMNVALCFFFGLPLLLMSFFVRDRNHLSPIYRMFVYVLMGALSLQTVLQIFFRSGESRLMQIAALGTALFMMLIYGLTIPSLWNVRDFVRYVQKWAGFLVLLSLLMLIVAHGAVFKGGRFIGVFKHIPHMVTCATVAFVFSMITLLDMPKTSRKIWSVLVLLGSFTAIVLTGTRSSAAAAILAFVVTLILHKSRTNQGKIFKFAFVSFVVTFSLAFGPRVFEFAKDIATGQSSLGSREAQDGVASRWEEIERGSRIFLEEPWLGHGLLSKFSAGDEADISSYNAMKDPHNIFISAGVIGGWPLLGLSAIALLLLLIGTLKALSSRDLYKRQVAIYLASHIPILVIYHVHLSLGGMADRLYWLVFGFVAASLLLSPESQNSPASARTTVN